ncbi:hypothetical protein O9993_06090 [Vibrio lentus]|nr:hypothetical protein [Vibrio lentus]
MTISETLLFTDSFPLALKCGRTGACRMLSFNGEWQLSFQVVQDYCC